MTSIAELMTEREAAQLVGLIGLVEEEIKDIEMVSDLSKKREQLKRWMGVNNLSEHPDGESGYVGFLQDRSGTPTYDLVSMAELDVAAEVLVAAARAGMLRVDHQMLTRFRKENGSAWADVLERYEMPGTGTTALSVRKPK